MFYRFYTYPSNYPPFFNISWPASASYTLSVSPSAPDIPLTASAILRPFPATLTPSASALPPGNNDAANLKAVEPRLSTNSSVFPDASYASGRAIFFVNAKPRASGWSIGTAVATRSRPEIMELVTGLSNTFSVNLPMVWTPFLIPDPNVLKNPPTLLKNPICVYIFV